MRTLVMSGVIGERYNEIVEHKQQFEEKKGYPQSQKCAKNIKL